MSDAPERIAFRWEVGAAITSGPLMNHPDYVHYVRADRIEDLERAVRYEADIAQQALDSRKELEAKLRESALQELSALGQASDAYQAQLAAEAKLAKAVAALDEAVYLLDPDEKDMMRKAGVYRIVTTLAGLEGETDE